MIEKGTWVQIHKIILEPLERAPQVPDDTKKVPFEMWVKGFLMTDSNMGDKVFIKTITNRIEEGKLVVVNPSFDHNFGHYIKEITQIGQIVKDYMYGGELNE